jgi:hypothetical protein
VLPIIVQKKFLFASDWRSISSSKFIIKFPTGANQGCQILDDEIYQNGEKFTKLAPNYQMALKIYQISEIYS